MRIGPNLGLTGTIALAPRAAAAAALANRIDNGTFDDAAGWTTSADAAISSGVLTGTSTSVYGTASRDVSAAITSGSFYRVTFTFTAGATAPLARVTAGGGTASLTASATGTYAEYVKAGATQALLIEVRDGTIDDVIVEGPFTASATGPNLADNGTFDDAAGWTLTGANATISGGTFNAGGGLGTKTAERAANAVLSRGWYRATFDILNRTAGSATAVVGGSIFTLISANGSHAVEGASAAANQLLRVQANSSSSLSVDNLTVHALAFTAAS